MFETQRLASLGAALCCTPDTRAQLSNASTGASVLHFAVREDGWILAGWRWWNDGFGKLPYRSCERAARCSPDARIAAGGALESGPLRRHRHSNRPRRHLVSSGHAVWPARACQAVFDHPAQGSGRFPSGDARRENAHPGRRRTVPRRPPDGRGRRADAEARLHDQCRRRNDRRTRQSHPRRNPCRDRRARTLCARAPGSRSADRAQRFLSIGRSGGDPRRGIMGVWSEGVFFPLGRAQ
jgi:hypothetical protein